MQQVAGTAFTWGGAAVLPAPVRRVVDATFHWSYAFFYTRFPFAKASYIQRKATYAALVAGTFLILHLVLAIVPMGMIMGYQKAQHFVKTAANNTAENTTGRVDFVVMLTETDCYTTTPRNPFCQLWTPLTVVDAVLMVVWDAFVPVVSVFFATIAAWWVVLSVISLPGFILYILVTVAVASVIPGMPDEHWE